MTHAPLTKAFLTSMLVHLTVLMSLLHFGGALRLAPAPSDLIRAELVMVDPPPAVPEPAPTSEVEPLTPPQC